MWSLVASCDSWGFHVVLGSFLWPLVAGWMLQGSYEKTFLIS